jgi:hypothetical protein
MKTEEFDDSFDYNGRCFCGALSEPGICPFAQEIRGEEIICDCCEACRHECAQDI